MFVCCFGISFGGMLANAGVAYAVPPSVYFADTSQETSAYFELYFGHNVAHRDFIGGNIGRISILESASGISMPASVYSNYSGGEPGDGNDGDGTGLRRYINVQVYGLQPDTSYTLSVAPGIRSSGGHVYDGLTYDFHTPGTKLPSPDKDPPPLGDLSGGGGNGGAEGNDTYGADTGTAASAELGESSQTVAVAEAEVDASRAAGSGGGKVYYLGKPGLEPGRDSEEVQEQQPIEPPRIPLAIAVGLAILLVLILVLAIVKRTFVWRGRLAR